MDDAFLVILVADDTLVSSLSDLTLFADFADFVDLTEFVFYILVGGAKTVPVGITSVYPLDLAVFAFFVLWYFCTASFSLEQRSQSLP